MGRLAVSLLCGYGMIWPLVLTAMMMTGGSGVGVIIMIAKAEPARASFVFGDSLVDAGNNNYIPTLARANFPFNGIDFGPAGNLSTGRFTNGRTVPDIIGQEMGLSGFAPPYLAPTTKGAAILEGVNYASGAGGILRETGRYAINRLDLDQQISYFAQTKRELVVQLGSEVAAEHLIGNAIFSLTIGANDFLLNYVLPIPITRDYFVAPKIFQNLLISRFREQLIDLYELGARKLIVISVPPIGCTPYQRSLRYKVNGECAEKPNEFILGYNNKLKGLVAELNNKLPEVMIVYANVYDITLGIVNNPQKYGFDDARTGCCGGGGLYRGLIPCTPLSTVCPNRSKHFFWDPYHSSEAANLVIAKRLLDGDTKDIFPMNIRTLASL